ncbi:hypothetical protein [Chlorobium phaeovibrioides]|uniref:hypothetical protein n=1 Tax=Chlorobium phaeovibrioides TaxID=1094 RepID=UPI001CE418DA|nr:hypothetical protein [Chlorobium phaeovibrioides]
MTSHYGTYAWEKIINRTPANPYTALNLITSLAFRKNLHEQLRTFEAIHRLPKARKFNIL